MACGSSIPKTNGLKAVIVRPNYSEKTVDSTGSEGLYIRLVIKREGVTIGATAPEINTGTNQIAYTTELSNGDELCIQTSHRDRFNPSEFVEDCKFIPKGNLAFQPIWLG